MKNSVGFKGRQIAKPYVQFYALDKYFTTVSSRVTHRDTNLHNSGKIPEIKHIVRFRRCGQEAGDSLSINLSDGADYNLKEKE